jgi:hypothetical protein
MQMKTDCTVSEGNKMDFVCSSFAATAGIRDVGARKNADDALSAQ